MNVFDKYSRPQLSCQNGCDDNKPQFERRSIMLVQEVTTGEVRGFCWSCLVGMSKKSDNKLLELRDEFVFWPVREDGEF